MTAIRRLPIRVAPVDGEAIDSWLEALAARCHTASADLRTAVTGRTGVSSRRWVVCLEPGVAQSISLATGVSIEQLAAMTLSRYDSKGLRIDPQTGLVSRAYPWSKGRGSRYCPSCLAESAGRWQLSWRLGWSFACVRHRCLLVDECPKCGRQQRLRPSSGEVVPAPGRCGNPVASGLSQMRCGGDLTDAATTVLPEHHPALVAQQLIYTVIDSGTASFGIYALGPQPVTAALSDVRAIAGRVLSYATDHELAQIVPADLLAAYQESAFRPTSEGRNRLDLKPGLAAPEHAVTAAVGVTAALAVLSRSDVAAAGEALRFLVEAFRERGLSVSATNISWGSRISPILTAAQLAALAPLLKPADQLRYRTSTPLPTHPPSYTDRIRRLTRAVPTMLWPAWSLPLTVPGLYDRQLRPAASAALLLVGTRTRRRNASALLSSPHGAQAISRALQLLTNHDNGDAILSALTRMADYLAEHNTPIDYHRRRRLDYTDLLPDSVWRQICRITGTAGASSARARTARLYLAEQLSGRPALDPTIAGEAYHRTKIADFPQYLTPELACALDEYSVEFLAGQGITDEPVGWAPPTDLFIDLELPGPAPSDIDVNCLHDLLRNQRHSLGEAAAALDTTLSCLRYVLQIHPAPAIIETSWSHSSAYRAARAALDRDTFTNLYINERRGLRVLAAQFGFDRKTLAKLAEDYGIALREPGRQATVIVERAWLFDQYVDHKRPLPELARELGISTAAMARWAKKHAIPMRSRGSTSHAATLAHPQPGTQRPDQPATCAAAPGRQ